MKLAMLCLLGLGCCLLMRGEIIDRIAISAGNQVITESQIDEEVRVTQFLNGEKLELSPSEKKKAADRLIEQALVKREMDLSRYPLPELSDADKQFEMLQGSYANPALFENALRTYGITPDEVKRRLWWQLTVLRFVEFRFRPGIQISDADVQAYYRQQLAKWQQEGVRTVPNLEEARPQIEEILTQQRIDEELDHWLSEVRMQVPIQYLDETLK